MLDVKDIFNDTNRYIKLLNRRGEKNYEDDILGIKKNYLKYNDLLQKEEKLRNNLNDITKKIKDLSHDTTNKKSALNPLKEKATNISLEIKKITQKRKDLYKKNYNELANIPNIPLENVREGKNEKDNKVLSSHLSELKSKTKNKLAHWDIIEQRKLIYSDESKIISGSRHIFFGDKLAKLIKALEQFMLKNNEKNGYKIVEVPVIVNKEMLFNTGQLPKFESDLYKITGGQYLIPTSEVPLTNFVANKILTKKELPIKLTASTLCFRKEAGAAGKDNRGLIRLHQFRKVEIVKIGDPKNFKIDFNEMIKTATNILEDLKIPYRLVELCTGDLSFSSQKTIDIEIWMPGTKTYREVSSISIVGDFQSRRMNTRFIDDSIDKNKKIIPFTYNGSSLAIERLVAAIIENYTNEELVITVPHVLRSFLDFDKI